VKGKHRLNRICNVGLASGVQDMELHFAVSNTEKSENIFRPNQSISEIDL